MGNRRNGKSSDNSENELAQWANIILNRGKNQETNIPADEAPISFDIIQPMPERVKESSVETAEEETTGVEDNPLMQWAKIIIKDR